MFHMTLAGKELTNYRKVTHVSNLVSLFLLLVFAFNKNLNYSYELYSQSSGNSINYSLVHFTPPNYAFWFKLPPNIIVFSFLHS